MRKFDTKVQYLRYKVLREVARLAFAGALDERLLSVPTTIIPGKEPTMRCCVYKERAIVAERVKLALGGDRENNNVIEVVDIACDECPIGGYEATDACRSCLAHRCEDVCRRGAITFDRWQKAHIDKSKCVECGLCAKVCPYGAIANRLRPCEQACKADAIRMSESKAAMIDEGKCTACGACVYRCPWGAINEKSSVVSVVSMLRSGARTYAVVAPAIASQFTYAKPGQVLAGIEALGFHELREAAWGADGTALAEAEELAEKGLLMSSCCPAFARYVQNAFPALATHLSEQLSPAASAARRVKQDDPDARVVFIGPCTAKKMEALRKDAAPYIDAVLTFEELQALLDSRDIDITTLPERELAQASAFGRGFARSGGVAAAIAHALEAGGHADFAFKPVVCDGMDACRAALRALQRGKLEGNFIEGMACEGGCVGGAGCLTHGGAVRRAAR